MNFIKSPHLVKDAKNSDCHVIGTLFSVQNLATEGPQKSWTSHLKKVMKNIVFVKNH